MTRAECNNETFDCIGDLPCPPQIDRRPGPRKINGSCWSYKLKDLSSLIDRTPDFGMGETGIDLFHLPSVLCPVSYIPFIEGDKTDPACKRTPSDDILNPTRSRGGANVRVDRPGSFPYSDRGKHWVHGSSVFVFPPHNTRAPCAFDKMQAKIRCRFIPPSMNGMKFNCRGNLRIVYTFIIHHESTNCTLALYSFLFPSAQSD